MGLTCSIVVLREATCAGPGCALFSFPSVILLLVTRIVLLGVGVGLDLFGRDDGHNVSTLLTATLILAGASESGTVLIVIELGSLVFVQNVTEGCFVPVSVITETSSNIVDIAGAEVVDVVLVEVVLVVDTSLLIFELLEIVITSEGDSGEESGGENLMHLIPFRKSVTGFIETSNSKFSTIYTFYKIYIVN